MAINLHHLGSSIQAHLGDGARFGVRVRYSPENPILGTGGGLVRLRDFLEGGTFLLQNGDVLTGVDLEALFEKHEQENAPTLALPKAEPKQKALLEVPVAPKKPKIKGLSAKAKAHIAAAAKARWAKIKAKGVK